MSDFFFKKKKIICYFLNLNLRTYFFYKNFFFFGKKTTSCKMARSSRKKDKGNQKIMYKRGEFINIGRDSLDVSTQARDQLNKVPTNEARN